MWCRIMQSGQCHQVAGRWWIAWRCRRKRDKNICSRRARAWFFDYSCRRRWGHRRGSWTLRLLSRKCLYSTIRLPRLRRLRFHLVDRCTSTLSNLLHHLRPEPRHPRRRRNDILELDRCRLVLHQQHRLRRRLRLVLSRSWFLDRLLRLGPRCGGLQHLSRHPVRHCSSNCLLPRWRHSRSRE